MNIHFSLSAQAPSQNRVKPTARDLVQQRNAEIAASRAQQKLDAQRSKAPKIQSSATRSSPRRPRVLDRARELEALKTRTSWIHGFYQSDLAAYRFREFAKGLERPKTRRWIKQAETRGLSRTIARRRPSKSDRPGIEQRYHRATEALLFGGEKTTAEKRRILKNAGISALPQARS
jgi:hypothetical protein